MTVVVPTHRRRIDVTGDDRARYLEDVTTQHLLEVPVTHVRSALALDPHGAPLAAFEVVVLGDRLVLIVPDDEVAAYVTDVLAQRTFLLDVRFELRDDLVVAVRGEDAPAVVAGAGLSVVAGRCRLAGEVLVVHRPDGVDLLGPAGALAEAEEALVAAGAVRGTDQDLEDARIRAGEPAWGRELAAPHLPEELGLLPTHVHLAKGCYPGQEAVARMWMLGRPRRQLAVVTPTGPVTPGWTAGTGRERVEVTSLTADGSTALAFVPASAAAGDRYGTEEEGAIEVVRVVGAEQVVPGHDPAMVRRRDRGATGPGSR
ncbi:MAG: YgfZ/GcvT domain-containing protein [Nitriliruptoraceae bacterium]